MLGVGFKSWGLGFMVVLVTHKNLKEKINKMPLAVIRSFIPGSDHWHRGGNWFLSGFRAGWIDEVRGSPLLGRLS